MAYKGLDKSGSPKHYNNSVKYKNMKTKIFIITNCSNNNHTIGKGFIADFVPLDVSQARQYIVRPHC